MATRKPGFTIEPIPTVRRFALDAGYLGGRRHIIHALIEVDVTDLREQLREHREQTGESLSFTAFVISCLGDAIAMHPHLHAYRDWRTRLVIFDDIHINAMIEVEMNGRKVPMPHVFKGVQDKSYRELHDELRAAQHNPDATLESSFMRYFLLLPAVLRRLFYWVVMRVPGSFRRFSSPVLVTAVGMFGQGGGWGIPMPNATLTVTVGGIVEKPGVFKGQIAVREYLDLTLSVDHDVVDGAPFARFVNLFRALLEQGDISDGA